MRALEHRAFLCAEEVRLNRRFAPELYLEVCPITVTEDGARMGGEGKPVEYAVKMRQFPREEELDNLLTHSRISPAELTEFGTALASVHAGLPVVPSSSPWGTPANIRSALLENLKECIRVSGVFEPGSKVSALRFEFEHRLDCAEPWMAQRREEGRVRECHGDLHAANIVRSHSRLMAFDGLEFEPAFRWIDVAQEVAFLLADLDARGYPQHEQAFLAGYLARSGDYQMCRLLPLYKAHHALVRAKVMTLSHGDAAAAGRVAELLAAWRRYLDCAERTLAPPRQVLVLMSGLSGSGKTWLAKQLAPLLGAVHLRSDVERKRLAGLADQARSHSSLAAGLYSSGSTDRIYEHLTYAAEHVLAGGYSAVVDATFARRDFRQIFHMLAERLGVPACLIECHAPPEVLTSRIIARADLSTDPSEADVDVLNWQRRYWEPPSPEEGWLHLSVDTTRTRIEDLLHRLRKLYSQSELT